MDFPRPGSRQEVLVIQAEHATPAPLADGTDLRAELHPTQALTLRVERSRVSARHRYAPRV